MSKKSHTSRKKVKTKPLFKVDSSVADKADPAAGSSHSESHVPGSSAEAATDSGGAPSRSNDSLEGSAKKGSSKRPPRPSFDLPPHKLRRAKPGESEGKKQSNLFAPPPLQGGSSDNQDIFQASREDDAKPEQTPAGTGITQAILSDVTGSGLLTADISATMDVGGISVPKKTLKNKITRHLASVTTQVEKILARLPEKERVLALLTAIKNWLVLPLFSRELKTDKLPPKLQRPAALVGKHAQRYHVVAAVLGFVVILGAIGLSGGEDGTAPEPKENGVQTAALVPEKKSAAQTPIEITATPLGDYPDFPWKDHLKKIIKSNKKAGIQDLFGLSPKSITSALKGLSAWGPTGYDLLPKTKIMEVFPTPYQNIMTPRLVFLFHDDKLFEIDLRYETSGAETLDDDVFKKFATKSSTNGTDPSGRIYKRHVDNEVIIEQLQKEDKYGRVFRSIVFSEKTSIEALGQENKNRKVAIASLDRGTSQLGEKKFDKAIEHFQAARKLIPSFGKAYVMEAIAMLRKQEFLRAEFLAHTVLGKTQNKRVRSEANGVKAITHLYRGKKSQALDFWAEAIHQDPANTDMQTYKKELEKGKYSTDRVAKTAARISCISAPDKKTKSLLQKALLARGNFPDETTYNKALILAKSDPDFNDSIKKWRTWECQ